MNQKQKLEEIININIENQFSSSARDRSINDYIKHVSSTFKKSNELPSIYSSGNYEDNLQKVLGYSKDEYQDHLVSFYELECEPNKRPINLPCDKYCIQSEDSLIFIDKINRNKAVFTYFSDFEGQRTLLVYEAKINSIDCGGNLDVDITRLSHYSYFDNENIDQVKQMNISKKELLEELRSDLEDYVQQGFEYAAYMYRRDRRVN